MTGGDITLISITQQFIHISLFSLHSDTSTLSHITYIQIIFEKQISVVNTSIPVDRYPYHWYTILLGATRALAHIGVHFTHHVFGMLVCNFIFFSIKCFLTNKKLLRYLNYEKLNSNDIPRSYKIIRLCLGLRLRLR